MRRAFAVCAVVATAAGLLLHDGGAPAAAQLVRMPASRPAAPLRVELWGDSLSDQASSYFTFFLGVTHAVTTRVHVYGGTALCDWLADMQREVDPANRGGFHPQVTIVQFVGNAYTSCVQQPDHRPLSGQALLNRYASDAATAVGVFAKAKIPVYFVSSPISRADADGYVNETPFGVMYSKLPSRYPGGGVRFIDAAAGVEWHGRYSATLPALKWEVPTGRWRDGTRTVVVRAADGLHFCPVAQRVERGVAPRCPVYSGGAERFASAMTSRIVRDYRLG